MESILRQKLPRGKFNNVSRERSRIMQKIRSSGNLTTEARLRAALVKSGIKGWKVNYRSMNVATDFFFPADRIAIFVDGCFWHACPICGHIPKTNSEFWKAKIGLNRKRDKANTLILEGQGVLVIRFWEHELADSLSTCIEKIRAALSSQ